MAITLIDKTVKYIGASSDTKPTTAPVGAEFYERDTKATYVCYDGTNWSNRTNSIIDHKRYRRWRDGWLS